jgi:hypothetical protein
MLAAECSLFVAIDPLNGVIILRALFQGTRLQIQPRDIAAYDQDLGINAAIYYSFNSGSLRLREALNELNLIQVV